MFVFEKLRVSLTKYGYIKIADLLEKHKRNDVLDHVDEVGLERSQVAKILGEHPETGDIPWFWDEIREFDHEAIEAFTFLAVVFSHHRLVEAFHRGQRDLWEGTLYRSQLANKEYTNLVHTMSLLGLCELEPGSESVNYSLHEIIASLLHAGDLVKELLVSKLVSAGWQDPDKVPWSKDHDLLSLCKAYGFQGMFGLERDDLEGWFENKLEVDPVGH